MTVGNVLGVRFLSSRWQRRLVMPAAAAGFLPYLAFAADPAVALALPLLFVSGACSMYSLGLDARVRDATEPLFARAMTLNSAGLITLQGIGFALAGAVAQASELAFAVTAAGIGGLLATTLIWRRKPRVGPRGVVLERAGWKTSGRRRGRSPRGCRRPDVFPPSIAPGLRPEPPLVRWSSWEDPPGRLGSSHARHLRPP
jgi:hypothetical protein